MLVTSLLIVTTGWCKAQTLLVPGENVFDKKWIRNGTYEMARYANSGGQQIEISSFIIKIDATGKALSVYTTLQMTGSNDISIDTSIADGNTFKPVYRSSFSKAKEMVVNYGKDVTGYYYDKQTCLPQYKR